MCPPTLMGRPGQEIIAQVISAQCAISKKDLDKGTEPGHPARDYVHELGGHDGCTNDDAGHAWA